MSSIAIVSTGKELPKSSLTTEEMVNSLTVRGGNAVLPEIWSISKEYAKIYQSHELSEWQRLLREAIDSGNEQVVQQLTEKIRMVYRTNLVFEDFRKVEIPIDSTKTNTVDVVALYDPYAKNIILMKYTIALSQFRNINKNMGEWLVANDAEEFANYTQFNPNETYIKGFAFNLEFTGLYERTTQTDMASPLNWRITAVTVEDSDSEPKADTKE